ncbi:hypothetical protein A2841_02560 [Candidatus Kaiserbacteria bacterium RIFCSPHIGHO2_01_FULL_48_10]|uniref:Uncharacterized protein n=1 Tax=Candidatus Kaiserbacteria bacterium RIFCSPHIGHO2_01_FULL_48_10 TaxID=1798476 RepID=A0A1F6C2U9_9BACT|nr:MAG: hypothetical protein A2841_02560 [Candidatus Kaiserbacteria bacterium RIFCSPHIGHO2_01_FULL_48_10]
MKRFFEKSVIWGIPLLLPVVALAQFGDAAGVASVTPLGKIIVILGGLVLLATPVVIALAFLAFFWGLAMYIFNTGSDEQRKKGVQLMIWGVIALFVMLSIRGIIAVLNATFYIPQDYGGIYGGGGGNTPPPRAVNPYTNEI